MDILQLKGVKVVPDIVHVYPDEIKNAKTPLVIDNGNYKQKCFFFSTVPFTELH